jgi:hypothetical protein
MASRRAAARPRVRRFAARIPERLKLGSAAEGILKQAMRGRLPAAVVATQSPFHPPLAAWLKSDLRDRLDVLSERSVGAIGLFNASEVESFKREHFCRQRQPRLQALEPAELRPNGTGSSSGGMDGRAAPGRADERAPAGPVEALR